MIERTCACKCPLQFNLITSARQSGILHFSTSNIRLSRGEQFPGCVGSDASCRVKRYDLITRLVRNSVLVRADKYRFILPDERRSHDQPTPTRRQFAWALRNESSTADLPHGEIQRIQNRLFSPYLVNRGYFCTSVFYSL